MIYNFFSTISMRFTLSQSSFFVGLFLCTVSFVLPNTAHAVVIFTEVMYDVSGTDTGHEWVEICNTGSADITLTDLRLREADTDHKIIAVDTSAGGGSLPAETCAVIADNPTNFKSDISGYTGKLFDSSFSLNNAGETLILRDADLADVDTLAYDLSIGAAGDGNTLSRTASGGWVATTPNPGVWNTSSLPAAVVGDSFDREGVNTVSEWKPTPTAYAYAGQDISAFVGVRVLLRGSAATASKNIIDDAIFEWNFGDGGTIIGKNAYHTYMYPGTYRAVLSVTSGGTTVTDTCTVSVSAADIVISAVTVGPDAYVEIQNGSSRDIDISSWYIRAGIFSFRLPDYTYLSANTKTRFPSSLTGVRPFRSEDVVLLRPDMSLAAAYGSPASVVSMPLITVDASADIPAVSSTQTHAFAVPSATYSETSASPQGSLSPLVSSKNSSASVIESFGTKNAQNGLIENTDSTIPSVQNAILASAAATGSPERSFWYIVLGGVIILGVAGVVIASGGEEKEHTIMSKQLTTVNESSDREADEYEILEDE